MRPIEVPEDFAQLLRTMQIEEDPRLNAVLAAARKKKWSTPVLAKVLRASEEATGKRIERASPLSKDVFGRQRMRAAARLLDEAGFGDVGDELREFASSRRPATQLNKAKRLVAGVEKAVARGEMTEEQAAIVAADSGLNGRNVPRWQARLNTAMREIDRGREYEPTPPPDISDVEIPVPVRGRRAMLDGRTLTDPEIEKLREMARIARHTNGAAEVGDEARLISEEYTRQLRHLTQPVEEGGRGFTMYYLAKVIRVTPRAIRSRLERHGFLPPVPSIAGTPSGVYLNKKIGGSRKGADAEQTTKTRSRARRKS